MIMNRKRNKAARKKAARNKSKKKAEKRQKKRLLRRLKRLIWSRAMLLAVLSGLLSAAAFLPFGVTFFILFSLAPLWGACYGAGIRRGGLYAASAGAVGCGIAFNWILPLIERHSNLGWAFAACGFAAWLIYAVLFWFLFGMVWGAGNKSPFRMVICVTAPVLLETVWPRIFCWHFGDPLVEVPLLAQTAALGGPALMTTLVILTNFTIWRLWRFLRTDDPFPLVPFSLTVVFFAGSLGYSALQLNHDLPQEGSLTVVLVHPQIPIREKHDALNSWRLYHDQQRFLFSLARRGLEENDGAGLVVFPEVLFKVSEGKRLAPAPKLPVPVFLGAELYEEEIETLFNVALLEQGGDVQCYRKHHLVLFGEHIPLSDTFPWIKRFVGLGSLGRGPGAVCMTLGDSTPVAPLICYEAIIAPYVRTFAHKGAQLLLNCTEDGWYSWPEAYQHLLLARMRAVENRRWLLRSVNNGDTAIIDPAGRVAARCDDPRQPGWCAGTVNLISEQTLYTRFGDWPSLLLLLFLAAAFTGEYIKKRKRTER